MTLIQNQRTQLMEEWKNFYRCRFRGRGEPREYWIIYRGPGFLRVLWFGSSPTPSSNLSRQNAQPGTNRKTEKERHMLTVEGRVGEEPNHNRKKAWSSITHSILSREAHRICKDDTFWCRCLAPLYPPTAILILYIVFSLCRYSIFLFSMEKVESLHVIALADRNRGGASTLPPSHKSNTMEGKQQYFLSSTSNY